MNFRWYLYLFVVVILALPGAAVADVVTDWNTVTLNAVKTAKLTSTKAARVLAMVHAAVYDSVNAIDKTHDVYVIDVNADAAASKEAAAASAAHRVLTLIYPDQSPILDTALAVSLSAVPENQSKIDGIALGQLVGDAIVEWRSGDHSNDQIPYTPGTEPGQWRPTPPDFKDAMTPYWRNVTTFGLKSGAQFRHTVRPPGLRSTKYTKAIKHVQEIGAKNSAIRTSEQTNIANFWADMPGTETTAGRWNLIAQSASVTMGNTLSENARLFALLNIALADAGIVAWDFKYYYNFWRPITAIREADTDNNVFTAPDPAWEPLLVTPAFPEFISAHSSFSGAAAKMLALFFKTDKISFTIEPYMMGGMSLMPRTYPRFSKAAEEAGASRIYGGIHFDFGNRSGLSVGERVSKYIWKNILQPI